MATNKKLYQEALAKLASSTTGALVSGADVGSVPTSGSTSTLSPAKQIIPNAYTDSNTGGLSAPKSPTVPKATTPVSAPVVSVPGGSASTSYAELGGPGTIFYDDIAKTADFSQPVSGSSGSGTSVSSGSSSSTYQSQYGDKIQSILDKILNREEFSYDFNADPLYQMYKDNYTQQGKLAMVDAQAQAAALTGGYGSSYGQQVGQQTYQGYMQELNNIIPDLTSQAYTKYTGETTDMNNQLSTLEGLDSLDYEKRSDDRNYQLALQQLAQSQAQWEAEMAWEKQQYYDSLNATTTSGSGSGSTTKKKTTTPTTTADATESAAWNVIAQNVANVSTSAGREAYNAAVQSGLISNTAENRAKLLYMEKTDRVR